MPLSNKLECGKLRHRIQIVQPSGAQDSWGAVVNDDAADWTTVCTCWASITAVTAMDVAAAGTFVSSISHKVTIRNPRFVVIGPNMQIWFEGRTFIIRGVANPDETNKMLYLFTTEIANPNNPGSPNAATNR
jgi:head-tail adaptor